MPEIGPIMRALELQRLIEDKVSEWRERSTRVAGASVADSYHQPLNFKRHTNRRKNSAEINRIIAKYSKPNKRAHEPYVAPPLLPRDNAPPPPQRPVRLKKIKSNLKLSKSEDNLVQATIMDHPDPSAEVKSRFDFSKYNARSCEDITAFVDIDRNKKSQNFEENSILNAKVVTKEVLPKKLHSISEDCLGTSELRDSGVEIRHVPTFVTSTPISRRRAVSENVPGFETCSNYSSDISAIRKGSSEPDILSVTPSEESIGTVGSKKTLKSRWKKLKPPFRKGTLDCWILWRGKKPRAQETR